MPRYVCGGPAGAMRTSSSLMFDVPVIGGRFMTPNVIYLVDLRDNGSTGSD